MDKHEESFNNFFKSDNNALLTLNITTLDRVENNNKSIHDRTLVEGINCNSIFDDNVEFQLYDFQEELNKSFKNNKSKNYYVSCCDISNDEMIIKMDKYL